jgi:hypothetical protein
MNGGFGREAAAPSASTTEVTVVFRLELSCARDSDAMHAKIKLERQKAELKCRSRLLANTILRAYLVELKAALRVCRKNLQEVLRFPIYCL